MEWGQIAAGLTWTQSLQLSSSQCGQRLNHFDPFKDYSPPLPSVITSPLSHAFTLQLLISWMTIEMAKGDVQFILRKIRVKELGYNDSDVDVANIFI